MDVAGEGQRGLRAQAAGGELTGFITLI